ncbi:MAG: MFS transporter [Boseongicola sp.]
MTAPTAQNLTLYPWFKFFQNLLFWQAIWFLFFQKTLSAADAILLYAVYDIATTLFEVPSGYMSDRIGRRATLIASSVAGFLGMVVFATGDTFSAFVLGQVLLGASIAFVSGTDSAFLYESLVAEGRKDEVEAQELRAWRFTFSGLACSAIIGGLMAIWAFELAFAASAVAFAAAVYITWQCVEPPHTGTKIAQGAELLRFKSLGAAFTRPVLIWLFALSTLMYGFSHIPFVFGQPFILAALDRIGLAGEAPLVSGVVTAIMMLISVGTSMLAPSLRKRLGLPILLCAAFMMQILLAAVLALTNSVVAIAFLFLRMVPDSLSRPFILARIQPLLTDDSRATYLSLKSLAGRVVFAASLWGASLSTSQVAQMAHSEIRAVLTWYVVAGTVCFIGLVLLARRASVDDRG